MPDKIITLDNLACFKGEIEKEIGASRIIPVTYSEFVDAITNSTLIPGMHYRITDFVTKINGVYDLSTLGSQYEGMYFPYATSAERQFDLIVLATGVNTYDENVHAIQHEGEGVDENFRYSDLARWEVKWTHKNDKLQYSFADEVNGKGIITYLKDEFDNSAFFDFKNVMNLQFALKRLDNTISTGVSFDYNEESRRYGGLMDAFKALQNEDIGNNLEFACPSLSGTSAIKLIVAIKDVSKATLDSAMDWTYMLAVMSQMMGTTVTLAMLAQLLETTEEALQAMTERQVIELFFNGDFYYTFDADDGGHYELSSLSFESYQVGGMLCHSNHIGKCTDALTSYMSSDYVIPNGLPCITFENFDIFTAGNYGNEFGTNCFLNVFGDGCYSNKLGNNSVGSKFGKQCNDNTFGADNRFTMLGYFGVDNTFESDCYSNYLGHNCTCNSFLSGCDNNVIGDSLQYSTFGHDCKDNQINSSASHITFENGVEWVRISFETAGTSINDVKLCHGVKGTELDPLVIVVPSSVDAPIEYKAQESTEIILGGNN